VQSSPRRTSRGTSRASSLATPGGEVWSRPGLDRRTRSAITLTALVALGREQELALHLRAALRNGLTREEIGEVLLHCAIYCGVPAANHAFAIAEDVLDQEEDPRDPA
jgi:alkylhydroperoxidase/carboxymuconolactone decarboxylase family protein YurZ